MNKMTKEQWKSLYKILSQIYQDFEKAYTEFENGRTKKIQEKAYKTAKHEITMADIHIKQYDEALELLTGGKEFSNYQRSINYGEFLRPQYFDGDMSIFLKKIEDIINEN